MEEIKPKGTISSEHLKAFIIHIFDKAMALQEKNMSLEKRIKELQKKLRESEENK